MYKNLLLRLIRAGRRHSVVVVATGIWVLAAFAGAQASHRTEYTQTAVELSLDKTDIVVGEPVILRVALHNISASPLVEVRANFMLPLGNGVEVRVQPPGELEYRYEGAAEPGTYNNVVLQIVRGRPEIADVLLLFDGTQPNGLLFSKPGTYTLSAKFRYHFGKNAEFLEATLPPTQIQVRAPEGDNQRALEMLGKPGLVQCLHMSMAPTSGTLKIISTAAEELPQTYLGALAMRAEGWHYTTQTIPDIRERGARLLMKYLENGVSIVEGDGAAWEIAAAWHRNKKYDTAREWIFWLVRNYPDSPRIQASDPLAYFYYLAPRAFSTENPWFILKESWKVPGETPPQALTARTGQ